ncbi:MAG TPA: hypothetical protein DD381_03440 [Lentisphaeria bacterium]|nr:MAG: hypothetical protein A2X47_02810 [Lentisphaerae bacterium GWF2_38_69]HBM15386.1 hypothetical protein [Lentisphaeria bacterium]
MNETNIFEKKSLKYVIGKSADWNELAKDWVGMANARGGIIALGIENEDTQPPPDQKIDKELPGKVNKRISELTINVGVASQIILSENGGEYIEVKVYPSISTIASTTDGKYYYRIADGCKPLLSDELSRLLNDKPSFIWETRIVKSAKRNDYNANKFEAN